MRNGRRDTGCGAWVNVVWWWVGWRRLVGGEVMGGWWGGGGSWVMVKGWGWWVELEGGPTAY